MSCSHLFQSFGGETFCLYQKGCSAFESEASFLGGKLSSMNGRTRFARRILRLLKVPKKKCRGLGMPRPRKRKLEDEARLELDHPAGQAAWRLAELGVFDPILVRVEINWL